jgi:hypothetical protein
MSPASSHRNSILAVIALVTIGNICLAQAPLPPTAVRQEFETRADLEAQASAAEAQHRTGEAWLLRSRLTKGDFQDGDRIVVQIEGFAIQSKAETLMVRAGKLLELPRMSDVKLDGVLRSELIARITDHLAQYLREPVVRATPLVRVALLGAVARPGYVYTAADIPLSDVIMKAGGPAPNADIAKVIVRRGDQTIWDAKGVRTALADGLSLDRLHIRAGDEIYVGERRHVSWLALVTASTSIAAILFSLFR